MNREIRNNCLKGKIRISRCASMTKKNALIDALERWYEYYENITRKVFIKSCIGFWRNGTTADVVKAVQKLKGRNSSCLDSISSDIIQHSEHNRIYSVQYGWHVNGRGTWKRRNFLSCFTKAGLEKNAAIIEAFL